MKIRFRMYEKCERLLPLEDYPEGHGKAMTTADFIREHHACRRGAEWALSISDDMADVWDAMIKQDRHDWLIWTATKPGVFSDSTLRKLACRFVRETSLADGRKVWDLLTDERSKRVVEVAERYADGKATKEDMDAAYVTAYAAADDAAYAAAVYAATAARDAAFAAVRDAAYAAARAAVRAADDDVAKADQVQMIAELGNPFKKERTGR